MWMGGNPPLGYDIVDRKLVINQKDKNNNRDTENKRGNVLTQQIASKYEHVNSLKLVIYSNYIYETIYNPLCSSFMKGELKVEISKSNYATTFNKRLGMLVNQICINLFIIFT